jgi:hypothetical protein
MATTSAGADSTRIYDELLVTTAEHVQPKIVENHLNAHPGMSIFAGNIGSVLNSAVGQTGAPAAGAKSMTGESIRVNAKLGKNESFRWLASGYSEIDLSTSDTARGIRANWKLGGGSVVIDGSTRRKNSGGAQILSILEHKQNDTTSSAVDSVAEALLTSSSEPHAITSLPTLISANDAPQGGISGATFSGWNSRGVSAKGTAAASISFASGSFASQGVADMRIAFMNAEEGSIRPNVILTTDAVYRYYEGSLTPQVRFEDLKMGDLSFSALRFKNAPLFHDPYMPSGNMFFLNTEYIFLSYLPGAFFDLTPMERATNQDAFAAFVLFEGQLVTNARKYQNKLTGITA